jgi:acyl-CoA thioesterase YciA
MPDRANAERCELPKDRMPMLRVNAEPRSTNAHGKVHAGWLMAKMDLAGALDAERVAKGPVTTVAVNAFQFAMPILLGDVVSFYVERLRLGPGDHRGGECLSVCHAHLAG